MKILNIIPSGYRDGVHEQAMLSYFDYVVRNDLESMVSLYREETGDNELGNDKEFCQRFFEWFKNDWEKGIIESSS